MTGYFEDTVDFDPSNDQYTEASNGGKDAFLSQFLQGKLQWVRTWGGPGDDQANGVTGDWDPTKEIFMTGSFEGDADLNPDPAAKEIHFGGGAFLIKLDLSGNFNWAKSWGANGDEGLSVSCDMLGINVPGDAFVTGDFFNTVDFDPSSKTDLHKSIGENDAFLSKFLPDGTW